MADNIETLRELEKKILWLASWTIHNANHLRENTDGLKVGGHQASSASLATIMTALYLDVLRPQDRVAVKPHASPIFHAIQYLLGRQTRERLEAFRGYKGAQSYPSRTKDADDVDFSTGSVGLGVAQTLFSSLVQDYVRAHGWGLSRPEGRMVALVGDAELDEGNIFEALLEGWKQGLRNCWWIIDYNRQSLDAVVREGLWERYEQLFKNFGWDVVILKYGSLQQAAFKEPGGDRLRQWIDSCPNPLYSALVFAGGAAWRKRLNDEIGDQGDVSRLIEKRSDDELAALMNNLGGHDLPSLLEAFHNADNDRPTCFIAYTVKGFGLPMAGHKDNHAGLMTPAQMEVFRKAMAVRPGHEWDKFEGLSLPPEQLQVISRSRAVRRRQGAPSQRAGDRRAGDIAGDHPAGDGDADRFRRAAQRDRPRRQRLRAAHRHDLARRDGLDQSRPLGEPARAVRAPGHGRHLQERAHPVDLQLGVLAQGPAYRARHRRDEPVHRAVGARPLAQHQRRAAAADRHAVRPLHRARPRCTQLCLLPGCALHSGGDAVGHHAGRRRRRASIDRRAADRDRAGRTGGIRAGLCRRTRGHPALGLRLYPEGQRRRAVRAQLAARRDRRLGLSAAVDAAGRADRAQDDAGSGASRSSTAPIGCASRGRTRR